MVLEDVARDFHPITKALFIEYVTNVVLHRPHTDFELSRDFFVTQAT